MQKKVVKPKRAPAAESGGPKLYSLEVFILEGLLTKRFVQKNRTVSRVIEIRGDQTLADLHEAIFDAFDRFDEHPYEFQFGKGPRDLDGPRYRRKMPVDSPGFFEQEITGVAEETTIDSLGLKVGWAFGYLFDFGDDWWHQIEVIGIDQAVAKRKYPRVTKRVGVSPPQYPDMDEMD